ncbi:MAG TPA: TrmH family RNA methyltransferase [Saprospiraceae bacterium]|jgi:tRNA G18 (ribose-2'-O)-methylase SpoU|nr:TrmH family RNA methyltransferase [Saprospiraceae bacterium]HRF40855.1 TrmH family RNA methyltransferase [Saprospiraceae bacterium]HRK83083.1 TrmH family RNA methyltransferase [Saprospiraceae bacterium]
MRKYSTEELGRPDAATFREQPKLPITIVLDNVRSALNVGSAFRTCDAFAIEEIILCGISAAPPHREIAKTALGATETVAWRYFADTAEAIATMQSEGRQIWVVEQTEGSTALQDFIPQSEARYALVFGNEVHGVEEAWIEQARGALEIPQWGAKHSLNVSVCVGVVLWEIVRKIKFA